MNRIAIYITAVIDITAALTTVLADLDTSQTGSVVAALAGINALAVMFLRGWQQYERALYQADLQERDRVATLEVHAAEADRIRAAGGPRLKSNVTLPR